MKDYLLGMVHFVNGQTSSFDLSPQTFQGLVERMYPDSGAPVTSIVLTFRDNSGKNVILDISSTGIGLEVDGERLY